MKMFFLCFFFSKMKQIVTFYIPYRNVPKFLNRQAWANNVEPDQTAPRSDSSLFAILSASFGCIILW